MHFLKRLALAPLLLVVLLSPTLAANSWYDFVTSEPSSSVSGGVNAAENMAPSQVNDAMRAWKQLEAAWLDDLGGIATVGGTSTAITVTLSQGFTAYGTSAGQIPNGAVIAIKTGSAATGATTLAVNGIATKAIRLDGDVAVQSGDWASGALLLLRYDTAANAAAGAWIIVNTAPMGYTGTGAVARAASPTLLTTSTTQLSDDGAAVGPVIYGDRLSASPAAADLIASYVWRGRDSAGNVQDYTRGVVRIDDPTSTSEDASLFFETNKAGTMSTYLGIGTNASGVATANGIGFIVGGVYFPSAAVFDWGGSDVTLTHSTNALAFAGASSGYSFDALINNTAGQYGFPATQNASAGANTLDDYQEATFTPAFASAGATFSYAKQVGRSIKIGKLVYYQVQLTLNTSGNTLTGSPLTITGLPETSVTAADNLAVGTVTWAFSTTSYVSMSARVNSNATTITLLGLTAAGTNNVTAVNSNAALHATNGSEITVTGVYEAAN